jgi:hypothetical protein
MENAVFHHCKLAYSKKRHFTNAKTERAEQAYVAEEALCSMQ